MKRVRNSFICVFSLLCCHTSLTWADDVTNQRIEFFERRIRPLLMQNCVPCHGPELQENQLRLDSRNQLLVGTKNSAPLVKPSSLGESRLWQVVQHSADDVQMPPDGKLTERQLADLKQWISTGAVWPESSEFGTAAAVDSTAWKQHWAFQPISDPPIPNAPLNIRHPIDAFIRHEIANELNDRLPNNLDQNWNFTPASARTLVRRISYAVTGLPPAVTDLKAADRLKTLDARRQWIEEYIDRLLASETFGERWTRYWLDIARYADTKGYVFREDREYKKAWRYREWVIQSFNHDQPYNEFLKLQIAADQYVKPDDTDQLAAMGFLTLGRRFLNNKHDIIDDRIDVLTKATLGLTVSCARCHDHKFDPIPTTDYYSLYSIFDSSDEPKDSMKLLDRPKPRQGFVFVRGNARNRGEKVARRYLTALSDDQLHVFQQGSGRKELANKIASADNPLTARVAANRIWMRLFGTDLVGSPSDFGIRTIRPRHAKLLDHLAAYLIRHNWSRKRLIKHILTSQTWQQSSSFDAKWQEIDPENRLFSRAPIRRLDFEAMRDSLLSVTGQLDVKSVGGPSVDITSDLTARRRTIYARIDRQNLPNVFRTFDFASPDNHAAARFQTTVPQQALFALNSEFLMNSANHLAQQIGTDQSPESFVKEVMLRVLQREPSLAEKELLVRFLTQPQTAQAQTAEAQTAEDTRPLPQRRWDYGWATLSDDETSLSHFQSFPVFHENRWSGGRQLPDKILGWASLTKNGGHPGHGKHMTTVRRWIAPFDGTVSIQGRLSHASDKGDGVAGYVFSANHRHIRQYVKNTTRNLRVNKIDICKGQPIDFVVTSGQGDDESFDSFTWKIKLKIHADQQTAEFDSEADFRGPWPEPLSKHARLCQTLLMTNEFLFVD